ncbi:MAG TPA: tyrosine-type recombinase/integrase [Solirubrobacteraceae bacterium]|nr:tyrosine-type recombinase/integrase [Solirubrobacteraceae bacterium]
MSRRISLGQRAQQYLAERRRLGFELSDMAEALESFTEYAERLGRRGPLTLEVMSEWARCDHIQSTDPRTWARRLKRLRPFTRWLRQFEPRTEVPDDTVFGPIGERGTPHIYSDEEIGQLMAAAGQLTPALRGATYATLFGLLLCTGLRISEAIRLRNCDVDLNSGVLTVRRTKFAKSRYVPLHASALERLRQYRRVRDRSITPAEESAFFVGHRGRRCGQPLNRRSVDRVLGQLRTQLGWLNRGAHHAPRVHDARHTFVVRRILAWQRQGVDIDQAMLALSTYVGHARVSNTYWYLTAVPELMALAAKKFESKMAPRARTGERHA